MAAPKKVYNGKILFSCQYYGIQKLAKNKVGGSHVQPIMCSRTTREHHDDTHSNVEKYVYVLDDNDQ